MLFVINDLARAGAEKQVVLLARGLKALGWVVSVVLIKERNDFTEQLSEAAIPVTSLRRRGPLDLGVVSRLRGVLKGASPDVVVSFLFLANQITALATSSLKPRPAVVLSVRCSYRATLTGPQRFAARLTHQGGDLILFNSKSALREEQLGFPPVSRVAYLPNCVPLTPTSAVSWADVGVGPGPVVLSAGQLEPVKGHRMLIEAFASLGALVPAPRLVLVGDGPERERLSALAATRGLLDRISFLGHRSEALPFIAAADVFVQPSLSEGMSNALMEAMALGRCIVATRVGAAPDLLEDGVQALLSEPRASDLSAALQRVLEDPPLRLRLGEAARARALDFSADRIVSALDGILTDLVQKRASGS